MESLQKVALVFTIIGAIVWGMIGLFDFNLIDYLFVQTLGVDFLAKLIYIIVGVCGIINIGILFNHIETK